MVDAKQIAHLARLDLTAGELKRVGKDLKKILGYIDSLRTLDLTDVEPTAHGSSVATPLREDVVVQSLSCEDALEAAPKKDGPGFVVPKVIG